MTLERVIKEEGKGVREKGGNEAKNRREGKDKWGKEK